MLSLSTTISTKTIRLYKEEEENVGYSADAASSKEKVRRLATGFLWRKPETRLKDSYHTTAKEANTMLEEKEKAV